MRLLRYTAGAATAIGRLDGTTVHELAGGLFDAPQPTGVTHDLADVTIEVPLLPRTFYAAGLNYTAHIAGAGHAIPEKPDMGYRASNALIAHGQPVVIPRDAARVQYEGELVVVIGREAKHLTEADALSCVFGYTIGNDVSERTWQTSDRTFWRSKNTDTFKPMGPWIETAPDLDAMETVVRLNGRETLRFQTSHMLFGVARFIATMTRYVTLHPGDVIWMGTDGASPDLVPGDTVEIELTGIGTLRNPFVLEGSP